MRKRSFLGMIAPLLIVHSAIAHSQTARLTPPPADSIFCNPAATDDLLESYSGCDIVVALPPSEQAANSEMNVVPAQIDARARSKALSRKNEVVQRLAQQGISIRVSLVSELSRSFREGREYRDASPWFAGELLNTFLSINGGKSLGWKGSSALVRLSQYAGLGSEDSLGEVQCFSNIDGPARTTVYELWFQQLLINNKVRVKVGKIDATTEFAQVPTAGDFLNSSMGYSPTIQGFPTYPEPKTGIGLFLTPNRTYALGLGAFQTQDGGKLSIAETARTWTTHDDLAGRVSIGYWRLDGIHAGFDGSPLSVTQGAYGVAEQSFWRSAATDGKIARALSGFMQFGTADGSSSRVTRHIGGGVVIEGTFGNRSRDSVGIAFTRVGFSADIHKETDNRDELIFETYYKLNISRQVAFVPDIQWIQYPSGALHEPGTPVVSQRVVVSF